MDQTLRELVAQGTVDPACTNEVGNVLQTFTAGPEEPAIISVYESEENMITHVELPDLPEYLENGHTAEYTLEELETYRTSHGFGPWHE